MLDILALKKLIFQISSGHKVQKLLKVHGTRNHPIFNVCDWWGYAHPSSAG